MGTDSDEVVVDLDLAVASPHARERRHPRWTFAIEGLGKIARGRVRTAPLTLFVGENNTGKSYLATLLWGLHRYLDDVIHGNRSVGSAAERACDEWIRAFLNGPARATLAPPDSALFLGHLNEILRGRASDLLARAFNREGLTLTHIGIEDLDAVPIDVELNDTEHDGTHPRTTAHSHAAISILRLRHAGDGAPSPAQDGGLVSIFRQTLTRLLVVPDERDVLYLPASRTGFMLLYPEIIKSDLGRRKIRNAARHVAPAELTAPMIEFLEFLALGARTGGSGPHSDLADALEAQLRGTVEIASGVGTRRFAFHPEGGEPLPMAMSSSLVTELTPIIAALRHEDFGFIVLEEPEAHLHPELQCVMARLLVRLVRRGVQVCVTTHSENFCQQINNLLKIGRLRELGADAAGYGPDEYLRPDDVAAYEFRRGDEGTDVVALETHADGIAMPLFNRALMRLSGETVDLQRAIDERTAEEP